MSLLAAITLVLNLYPTMRCDNNTRLCQAHEVCALVNADERIKDACEAIHGDSSEVLNATIN